jgi:hypothetical protein
LRRGGSKPEIDCSNASARQNVLFPHLVQILRGHEARDGNHTFRYTKPDLRWDMQVPRRIYIAKIRRSTLRELLGNSRRARVIRPGEEQMKEAEVSEEPSYKRK